MEIFDNGSGMSRQDIVNGFMRLSTYSKVERPTSPKYRRQRAGRKGIGRFAAQRLGEILTITTATDHDEIALTVRIDWREFSSNRELSRIPARISRTKKTFAHGTL
ncbi:ATP-binding protein, partial [Trichormus sp. NMC-1]|uniref:ATP-binding protein n=1 Tax=Trichormus sp. NMC-1 TaxID=1853259 RepID=UPI001F32B989